MFTYNCLPPLPLLVDDRDLLINSIIHSPAVPGLPGPQGPAGPQGSTGSQGEPGPAGSVNPLATRLVSQDYTTVLEDDYIGVNCQAPVTLTLNGTPQDGNLIIVKLEMAAPIGNRKVTVAGNGRLIDGVTQRTLQQPYECIRLLFRGAEWHII